MKYPCSPVRTMRRLMVALLGLLMAALVLGQGVAVEPAGVEAEADQGTDRPVFEAEVGSPRWHYLDLTLENDSLLVGRTYSGMIDTWLADAVLVYDQEMHLIAGLFTKGEIRSSTWSSLQVKVGETEAGVSTYQPSEDGPDVAIGIIFMGLPKQVQVVLWAAGPDINGSVWVDRAEALHHVNEGPEAYAVTMADFESDVWAQAVLEKREVEATPAASYDLPVQHQLVGLALPPTAGVLTLQSGGATEICRCSMMHPEEWLAEDATFLLSGATRDNVTIIAADIDFARV